MAQYVALRARQWNQVEREEEEGEEREKECQCYEDYRNPWSLYSNLFRPCSPSGGDYSVFRQHLYPSIGGYYNQQIIDSLHLVEPVSPCTCTCEEEEEREEEEEEERECFCHHYQWPPQQEHQQQHEQQHEQQQQMLLLQQLQQEGPSAHLLPDCGEGELSQTNIINFAMQIARGMEHLQKMKVDIHVSHDNHVHGTDSSVCPD